MRTWLQRLAALAQRRRLDDELDVEIRDHLAMAAAEYEHQGLSPAEARRAALRSFGGVDQTKERHRDDRGFRWLDDLVRDLTFGCRTLRRSPGFATVAVLTLGIAIGANTAVFSVVEGVLLEPLPYHAPDRLVALYDRYVPESGFDIPQIPMSLPELLDYRDQTRTVAQVGYYRVSFATIDSPNANPIRVDTSFISANLLPVLGVQPLLGRWFSPDEALPDGPRAALLSHALWSEWFGQDPAVVGRTVTVDGVATEIIGVMPEGFGFPNELVRLYLGIRANEASPGARDNHGIRAIGRLADGQTLVSASAELRTMMNRWAQTDEHHRGHVIFAVDPHEDVIGNVRATLWTVLAVVGLVLLIAAANVANLLLARGETRGHEVSIRVALGAGRGRVVRQLLTESVLIAGIGGLFGVGLAWLGLRGMAAISPTALPRMDAIGLDRSVLAFTALCSLGTAVLFGLVPALQAGRRAALSKQMDARTVDHASRERLRRGLIVAEVAVSVVVVVSAGLVVRSFQTLTQVDSGMTVDGVVTFNLSLSPTSYRTPDARLAFFDRLLERLDALPGVEHASFLHMLPIPNGGRYLDLYIEGQPAQPPGEMPRNAPHYVVSTDYVGAAGLPVLLGRDFNAADDANSELVGLISETAVRQFWPNEDPIGQRIGYDGTPDEPARPSVTIVGVVGDIKVAGLQYDTFPQIYVLQSQTERLWGSTDVTGTVLVRTTAPLDVVMPYARDVVAALDPALPITSIRTLADIIAASVARPRLVANLLGIFGIIALLLAAVGVYGVVSYSVARKTREIGIRVALGADHAHVVWRMTRDGTVPALLGVTLGLGMTLVATRAVEGLLFKVSRTDPLTLTAVPGILLTVALAASWIPSRRAVSIAPTDALRAE
jgi:putative ABC transport system permease protein